MLTGAESCNYIRKLHLPQSGSRGMHSRLHLAHKSAQPFPNWEGSSLPVLFPPSCVSQLFLEASNMEEFMTHTNSIYQWFTIVFGKAFQIFYPTIKYWQSKAVFHSQHNTDGFFILPQHNLCGLKDCFDKQTGETHINFPKTQLCSLGILTNAKPYNF